MEEEEGEDQASPRQPPAPSGTCHAHRIVAVIGGDFNHSGDGVRGLGRRVGRHVDSGVSTKVVESGLVLCVGQGWRGRGRGESRFVGVFFYLIL
jgi:hypothetical protein